MSKVLYITNKILRTVIQQLIKKLEIVSNQWTTCNLTNIHSCLQVDTTVWTLVIGLFT